MDGWKGKETGIFEARVYRISPGRAAPSPSPYRVSSDTPKCLGIFYARGEGDGSDWDDADAETPT